MGKCLKLSRFIVQNLFDALVDRLKIAGQKTGLAGAVGASKALILKRLIDRIQRPIVAVTRDAKEAARLVQNLRFFASADVQVRLFPPLDILPYYNLSPQPDVIMERLNLLWELTRRRDPFFTVVPLHALTRRTIPRKILLERTKTLAAGEEISRDSLIETLAGLAYQRVPLVEDRGTFAVRGGIVDIFSPAHPLPLRLEFFGDTIESIRFFDPVSQKSQDKTEAMALLPAREILLSELGENWKSGLKKLADDHDIPKPERDWVAEKMAHRLSFNGIETFLPFFYPGGASGPGGTLFDYLPSEAIVCLVGGEELVSRWEKELEEHREHQEKSTSIERMFAPEEIFLTTGEIDEGLGYFSRMDFAETGKEVLQLTMESNALLKTKLALGHVSEQGLKPLADILNQRRIEGCRLFLVSGSPAQQERLSDLLARYEIPLLKLTDGHESRRAVQSALEGNDPSPFIQIVPGPISEGFYWAISGARVAPSAGKAGGASPSPPLCGWLGDQWWITDEEIFGQKGRTLSKKPTGEPIFSFSELAPGDFIVHRDHGIAVYKELVSLKLDSVQNDFLLLEYLGGDRLYVPVDKLNLITRYAAKEGHPPMLDKMGGTSWKRAREKVKRATRRLARELLELQAVRQAQKGYAFSPRDELFEEFEATFSFEETSDQLQAIDDVISDMTETRPMDRLVCGDVGYGKTEIAIRAAFKAVEDKKQAAVLVPTTILAFQHFETFKKRLENFPVTVELLSRFQTAAEQKKIVQKLAKGETDIVIATHRLLSTDVRFGDLGLLVIDEEHRFGVAQKEKIKKLKKLVDVLTLSATPIPRTLNFALVGIRDLSVINTPPADRLSIRTYVTRWDSGAVREAILHEMGRGGQVFFVHNRIQTIEKMRDQLRKTVPEIRIEIAHGRMNEDDLEEVMIGFMEKKFEVLLCTAIIESGLDIPSANTIIINRADHFGLAQLYQLRGRVGRSSHRAYAYLLVPDDELITEDAKKRLSVIQRFTELGSGFKIAEYDLEIRGAGNILGPEQSGMIHAVGYDLYVSLLKQAVAELKGEETEEEIDPELKLNISAYLPEDYIADTSLRLQLYKQLAMVEDELLCLNLAEEWADRFGPLPEPSKNLIALMRIKILAKKLRLNSVAFKDQLLTVQVDPSSRIPTEYFLEKVKKEPKKYRVQPNGKFVIDTGKKLEGEVFEAVRENLSEMLIHIPPFEKGGPGGIQGAA
ncbi:MAG: transcription-repair coupling factor [Deltaproteobacteria bacterium]|nr:transcription-repair coupling factor [Deltaproteobacteria bacterium]